jgi:hypothetical protein
VNTHTNGRALLRSFLAHRFGRRGLILAVILGVAVVALYRVRISIPVADLERAPPGTRSDTRSVGSIFSGVTVRQEILATGGEISAVELHLATYARRNRGSLTLRVEKLEGARWTRIAEKKPKKQTVLDNSFRRFRFSPPLSVNPGQRVAFILTADDNIANAITWWMQEGWTPAGTRLSVNGTEVAGMAHVHVIYGGVPMLLHLAEVWSRVGVFLGPVGSALFFSGLLLWWGGMIALLMPWLEKASKWAERCWAKLREWARRRRLKV